MGRTRRVITRTLRAFYDDQMTHHAAALTYYALMSLFPAVLLGLSLMGLLGQYPGTYDAVIGYLRDVAPATSVDAVDDSLRDAVRNKGSAATALAVALVAALYGTTGVLEATRRALNVVFEVQSGRSFLRRKAIDIASTFFLMGLALLTLTLMFVGGGALRSFGAGQGLADVWGLLRWPVALGVAMLVFSAIYYVTPDVRHRGFRWVTPGAVVGVLLWLAASYGFSAYVSNFASVSAIYGAFAAAIFLVVWLWLSAVALLFGAELDSEIEREKELSDGLPREETLALPAKG